MTPPESAIARIMQEQGLGRLQAIRQLKTLEALRRAVGAPRNFMK